MLTPFTYRALSPGHASAVDLPYLLRVIAAARRYGFNAIQICGCELDGITVFRRFPKANDIRDMEAVRQQQHVLREACKAAHDAGLEMYYWHHELWYPQGLEQAYPDWFQAAPDNRFRRDLYVKDRVPRVEPDAPFWQFLDAKFDEAFEQVPELDGTIMTIQESRVPIYCLFDDFEQQVAALVGLYQRLERAHQRVGRKWAIRTFAWREHEYRVVTEAVNRWRPSVPVESKGTAMDWHLFHPYDPLLERFGGLGKRVEVAPSCEFYGASVHPVCHPWFYTENIRFAGACGHTGAAVRIDRVDVSMLGGPDEGVLACIGRFLNDPAGTDVGKVFLDWLAERYKLSAATARRLQYGVLENCWQATLRTYHQDKIYIGDSFWQLYDKFFFVAERDMAVEHDVDEPLAEKVQAVQYADQAAATLEDLRGALAPGDYADLSRRVRFMQLTTCNYRALVAGLVARREAMYEPTEANRAALAKAVDALEAAGQATVAEFPFEAKPGQSVMDFGQRQPGELVVRFAQTWRKDLPNLPARRVLTELPAEVIGPNASFRGVPTHQFAQGEKLTIGLPPKTSAGNGGRYVLVMFAGTEMCVRRPIVFRWRHAGFQDWEHRFDVGQFAWFLAHDRVRRYEAVVPTACAEFSGQLELEVLLPEPEFSPFVRRIRLEFETPGRAQ